VFTLAVPAACSSSSPLSSGGGGQHHATGPGSGGASSGGGKSASSSGATGGGGSGTNGTGGAAGGSGATASGPSATGSGGAGGAPPTCDVSGPLDCSPSQAGTYQCLDLPLNFQSQVNAAIEAVLNAHPEWFDFNQGPAPCCPLVLQPSAYVDAVVAELNGNGLCAAPDPNDAAYEIAVKLNNACDEGYSILTSANIVRHPPHPSYTCVPAWL
jgi:hypothetical protein